MEDFTEDQKKQLKDADDKYNDDLAVDQFARAMKDKLAKKRAEGKGGWQTATDTLLEDLLLKEAEKDVIDPIDAANYACFLWNNKEARGDNLDNDF